jgi:hypothetical protein
MVRARSDLIYDGPAVPPRGQRRESTRHPRHVCKEKTSSTKQPQWDKQKSMAGHDIDNSTQGDIPARPAPIIIFICHFAVTALRRASF